MEHSWVSIKRRFLAPNQHSEEHDEAGEASGNETLSNLQSNPDESEAERGAQVSGELLDATGRQNELIRVGMGQVVERLDELTRLKEDITALIIEPVTSLITDFPQVQAKLLETEEILRQEQESGAVIRRDMRDLAVAHEKLTDEFTVVSSQYQHASRVLRDNEAQVESLSLALREQEGRVSDLERQLSTEKDRARVLSDELKAVRQDAQQADAAVGRLERDLAEARETIEILEFDNQALRTASTEQSQRLAAFDARQLDLDQQLQATQEHLADLQTKLDAEHSLRKKLEAQLDAERTGARVEIAALEMKVEGTTSRMSVTEKILSHTREQLREKTDELKAAERMAKEAVIDKNTLEHRLEAAQQELERQTALASESTESRTELAERCEMLTKAIAAKESLLQRSDHRTGMLLDRIDQLTRKFEDDRNALETKNKKLWEELQREKSERALAQGALETARRTRIEVEREFARIQRARRSGAELPQPLPEAVAQPDAAVEGREGPATNVMAFKTPEADEARPA